MAHISPHLHLLFPDPEDEIPFTQLVCVSV